MDVELHNIARNHSHYQGRCIRTVGVVTSRLIVEDAARLSGPTRSKTSANTSLIGVYWNDKNAYKKFHKHPERVTIVGRLDSCERLTRKAEADADEWNKKPASERQDQDGMEIVEIPILSGPCHDSSGPVIFIFAYQVLKNPVAPKQPSLTKQSSETNKRYSKPGRTPP
ncbi:MAG: hypothetical protein J0I26_01590 [Alphaproteobacteria bacterium]|nr:hypothetical protein [Alphaproteobacteria bacterium]MBN9591979.1 hypothetical protein [Alphaproteobacteria bacterium]